MNNEKNTQQLGQIIIRGEVKKTLLGITGFQG